MRVVLVNTNRMRPPIGPIGIDYLAEALNAAGHRVEVLNLCREEDWRGAVAGYFSGPGCDLIGVTLRNTDDCAFTSRVSFLDDFAAVVDEIRLHSKGMIVLGGVGFSTMPERILDLCNIEAGIWGDGEFAITELADRIERNQDWHDVPNLVWRGDGGWHRNPPHRRSLDDLPAMSRSWIDNRRYFDEGGQAGIETKRGCLYHCIYCADPIAKGTTVRLRKPEAVADELEKLLEQGIDHIHTCDSEFNIPERHAMEVCREIVRRNFSEKFQWYAYCSPAEFSTELAGLMRKAGCAGINFGVDSGDAAMLKRLKRDFTPEDLSNAARRCREAGIKTMFDLLIGAPGESKESVTRTIELMKQAGPDRV